MSGICQGADPEKNLPTINQFEYIYIYGNFRESLILGIFVKSTILNIKINLPYLGLTDIVTGLWNATFQWRLQCFTFHG